jgi:hypothetical protein
MFYVWFDELDMWRRRVFRAGARSAARRAERPAALGQASAHDAPRV